MSFNAGAIGLDIKNVFMTEEEFKNRYLGNELLVWGCDSSSGALGQGNISSSSSPVQTLSKTNNWKSISVSSDSASGIKSDGTLWIWGVGTCGQLGLNSTTSYSSPVQVGTNNNWKQVSGGRGNSLSSSTRARFGIKCDGTLWAWGQGFCGQLGLNNTTDYSSPVQVGTNNNWKSITTVVATSFAIKNDGTLWTWGVNEAGIFGLGITGSACFISSPTQVAGTNWKSISSGGYGTYPANFDFFVAAIKCDGTLWTWGKNNSGRLGVNCEISSLSHSSPVQVGTNNNWKSVSLGELHALALKTNGTLWAWGDGLNICGALGLNDMNISRSSPTQVGTSQTWKEISSSKYKSFAIKTDGTLWAWGQNDFGQLGLGDAVNRSSPTQIGTQTYWNKLAENSAQYETPSEIFAAITYK